MPRAGQPPVKRSSGKSIVSHGSSGSIESPKEALAARQNSFGLVQRADSMTVPNGTAVALSRLSRARVSRCKTTTPGTSEPGRVPRSRRQAQPGGLERATT